MASVSNIDNINEGVKKTDKESPPIKLKRTWYCSGNNSGAGDNNVSLKFNESISSNGTGDNLNGLLRSKRICKSIKRLIPRSFKLNVFLKSGKSRSSISDSDYSDCSSPVSINSYNIETLFSPTDNQLSHNSIKSKKSDSESEGPVKKRLKLDYDESDTSFKSDDSYFGGDRSNIVFEDYLLEPIFNGYQLVGDSQLLRFAQHILGMARKIDHNGKGYLGLCVGGQRICDLHNRVKMNFVPVSKKLIVMIGTNDLLKGTTINDTCQGLKNLLDDLFEKAEKIILLTVPPVPKLAHLSEHWSKFNAYNDYIFSIKDIYKNKLDIIDISKIFYTDETNTCYMELFELTFNGMSRRPDLIHINEKGFKLMRDLILKEIV